MSDTNEERAKTQELSRREFVKGAALLIAGAVAGCAPQQATPTQVATAPTALPTATPTPMPPTAMPTPVPPTATHTPQPTATPSPTETRTATVKPTAAPPTATVLKPTAPMTVTANRASVMQIYPKAKSRVTVVRHPDAYAAKGEAQANLLRKMLDAGIAEVTGLQDANQAWSVLFDSRERVGIKVNCIGTQASTVGLAAAIANRLHDAAGIPLENVVIWDREEWELKRAGFTINRNGPGIRCYSTMEYKDPVKLSMATVKFSDVFLSCDALINLTLPKEHGICGVTLSMKNHYGTIGNPGALHGNQCDPAIPELNLTAPIRQRQRLIIGDALRICPYNWETAEKENALLFAFDPVAYDLIGRKLLIAKRQADGRQPDYLQYLSGYIATAAKMGLGTDNPDNMELKEIKLS